MYRSLGLAIAVVSSMAAGAVAADLPSRKYAPVAPIIVAPAFTWTGFYVGLNAGYGFSDSQIGRVALRNDAGPGYAAWATDDGSFSQWSNKRSGSFVGGGQIGYNYQIDAMVIGLEADINYADISSERSGFNRGRGYYDSESIVAKSSVNWFGTLRARVGALVNDRLLIFATGGLAFGGVEVSGRYIYGDGRTDRGIGGKRSSTRTGWTLGAGLEYAITDNLTLKGEYAYVDLGSKTHRFSENYQNLNNIYYTSARDEAHFHVIRAGLNYRFW